MVDGTATIAKSSVDGLYGITVGVKVGAVTGITEGVTLATV